MKFQLFLLFAIFAYEINCFDPYNNICGQCPQDCRNGFEFKKEKGSCICICGPNLCEGVTCPNNSTCKMRYGGENCVGDHCLFKRVALCILKNKPGECPMSDILEEVERKMCDSDADCKSSFKCCPSKSYNTCAKPCPATSCKCASNLIPKQITNPSGCSVCICGSNNTASQTPKDVCSLPKEVGPCKGSLHRYYFDSDLKQCKIFAYGGCQGNENNFITMEFCNRKCGKPVERSKSLNNKCSLDKEIGFCRGAIERYYFNSKTKKCENFTYGGCGGNENNFITAAECNKECSSPVSSSPVDKCFLNSETGPCRASIKRHFFNKNTGKCEEFLYGGCLGNENNFANLEECNKNCNSSLLKSTNSTDKVCDLAKEVGPCKASLPRFFFNKNTKKCESFSYGGCQGNDNNFKTIDECNNKCGVMQERIAPASNPCELEKQVGPCEALIPRFYYNKNTKACEKFNFGGCKANENNFEKLEDCNKKCVNTNEKITPNSKLQAAQQDKCALNPERGICKINIKRYFFNSTSNKCQEFVYGGCGGNENNFDTEQECKHNCINKPQIKTTEVKVTEEDICSLPADKGPCKALAKLWYFNSANKKCEIFFYGGCQGNKNNFNTESECISKCGSQKVQEPPAQSFNKCEMEKDSGPCYAAHIRYFYNPAAKTCEKFVYGGCMGNENNFETKTECLKECGQTIDKCSQPMEIGNCMAALQKYFYNSTSKTCEPFTYGGCMGNENNFDSKELCQKECSKQEIKPVLENNKNSKECPSPIKAGLVGLCMFTKENCLSDSECKPNQKCCKQGCNKVCIDV